MLLSQAGRYDYSQSVNPAEFWMVAVVLLAVGVAFMTVARSRSLDKPTFEVATRFAEYLGSAFVVIGIVLFFIWAVVR